MPIGLAYWYSDDMLTWTQVRPNWPASIFEEYAPTGWVFGSTLYFATTSTILKAIDPKSGNWTVLGPNFGSLEKQWIRPRRAVGRAAQAILHVPTPSRKLAVLDEVGELSGPVGARFVEGHHVVKARDLRRLPVVAAVARLPGKAVAYRLGDGRKVGERPGRGVRAP